jgi:hypothetical protein
MLWGCTSLESLNLSWWDFRHLYSSSVRENLNLYGIKDNLKRINLTNAKFSWSMGQSFDSMDKL